MDLLGRRGECLTYFYVGARGIMNNQKQINDNFAFERKKHFDFFLPYYQEENWQVIEDNIDGDIPIDWDVRIEVFAGEYKLVDEKARKGEYNDCLIEIIQDLPSIKKGWYYGQKDWVLYGSWESPDEKYPSSLYLIKIKELRKYIENLDGFIKTLISKKGYGITWNVVVGWEELIREDVAEKLI